MPATDRDRLVDELLVLQIQGGDGDAFERLAQRWQERLLRHALRLGGRDDLARDAVQDAWIAVARGIGRLRDPGAFPAWIYRIVTRRVADLLRTRGPADTTDEPDALPDPASLPDAQADARAHAVESLRRALARLDGPQRALVSLHHLDGLDLRELATAFDVPLGTIKSRLHHARARLRAFLTPPTPSRPRLRPPHEETG